MYPRVSPLLIDLYQLTMAQAYLDHGMDETAVFELFVRKLPPNRAFMVAAGLEQAIAFLLGLEFNEEELNWLNDDGRLSKECLDYLAQLRFSGDVHAMAEGTVFFPDEPILRVTAPLAEAQLVESRLINLLHFQTLIATKAARCVLAAPGKLLVDFGLRRSHGAEAGLMAARASYIAGFAGTSTVLAAPEFGIPILGTMAHSFVQAHDEEILAFEHFARSRPHNLVLLIDTYDTEQGARKVAELAPRLRQDGIEIKAVRLDSGDLAGHSRRVREILDQADLRAVAIFSSGNLDEYALEALLKEGAPIDGFGVGTHMDISVDAPSLDCAYKLQEHAGKARRKRSEGKATWPGRKQVYRQYRDDGSMVHDVLTLENDRQEGEALIRPVMHKGRRLYPAETLEDIRERAKGQLARLPPQLRLLQSEGVYPVTVSAALRELTEEVDRRLS